MHKIVKYKNRKLYNKNTSSYVTLNEIEKYIWNGETIQVTSAVSQKDLTYDTLTAILKNKLNTSNNFSQTDVIKLINQA